LQEQEFEPIGSSHTIKVDVRVIAATNRDLGAAIGEGKFRSDLFYRLNVFPLRVPALRERAADVPLLAKFFVQRFAQKLNRPIKQISDDALAKLSAYPWPGNIRELQNVIERAVVLAQGPVLTLAPDFGPVSLVGAEVTKPASKADSRGAAPAGNQHLAPPAPASAAGNNSLEDVERRHIEAVLAQAGWMIEGARGAAKALGMNPSTLRSRMQKLGIKRPASRA
jgi:formate hydrogenlyase transcriptional activator